MIQRHKLKKRRNTDENKKGTECWMVKVILLILSLIDMVGSVINSFVPIFYTALGSAKWINVNVKIDF